MNVLHEAEACSSRSKGFLILLASEVEDKVALEELKLDNTNELSKDENLQAASKSKHSISNTQNNSPSLFGGHSKVSLYNKPF